MIANGADDWNSRILFGLCLGGHKEIIEIMIYKGADDWNRGLSAARYNGYNEIAEYMISKGAIDS